MMRVRIAILATAFLMSAASGLTAQSTELDIPYVDGAGHKQQLDLFAPETDGFPTILFVHGGSLTSGDRKDEPHDRICRAFVEFGIACAAASYRLAPDHKWPAQPDDAASAFAWLRRNIAGRGGDPDRIFLFGHSSGCLIVASLAADEKYLARAGYEPADVAGVIPLGCRLDDYVEVVETRPRRYEVSAVPPSRVDEFLASEGVFTSLEQRNDAVPSMHVDGDLPPTLVLIAEHERFFPPILRDASEFVGRALSADSQAEVDLVVLDDRRHVTALERMVAPDDPAVRVIAAFIGAHVPFPAAQDAFAGVRPFAPGSLPTGDIYRGTFSPDGAEFYYFRGTGEENDYRIHVIRREGDGWTASRPVELGGEHSDLYPTVSPDGGTMVFASYRPFPGGEEGTPQANLWRATRVDGEWRDPRPLAGVSRPDRYESHPILEPDGRLSFRRALPDWSREEPLVASPDGAGGWTEPVTDERIDRWRGWREGVHLWGGLVHPSGDLVVLDVSPVQADGRRGRSDLWVSERTDVGWSEPRPAGGAINTDGWDNFPAFTPSGDRLVFVRDFDHFLTAPLPVLLGAR